MTVRVSGTLANLGAAQDGGSPKLDKKKQFATIALAKNTRQRRPSTVKLFANSVNPFADAATPVIPQQRDDSSLEQRKGAETSERDNQTFDAQQTRHLNGVTGREAEMLAQYKAREPQMVKQWSLQQPFQFGTAVDVALAGQGFVSRKEEERMSPQDWEQKVASYNEWELGMLHKLAKVAELLLTPDATMVDQQQIEERLDEIARQDASERAKPAGIRRPSTPQDLHASSDAIEPPPPAVGEGTPSTSKKKSPRSPESQRKNFGSWSAKVAAAKKKSLERKKGADTLSQLKAEEGTLSGAEVESLSDSKSLFAIWNKDGTVAQPASRGATPAGSPVVQRKSASGAASSAAGGGSGAGGTSAEEAAEKKSGSGKKPNPNVLTEAPSPSLSSKSSTPKDSRKSNRFSSIRVKRNSVRIEEDEGPAVAFPGLSLRSADAASFQELLKMDKQRKETEEGPASPTAGGSDSQVSTPTLAKRGTPERTASPNGSKPAQATAAAAAAATTTETKQGFGRRTSVKSPGKSEVGSGPTTPSHSPPPIPSVSLAATSSPEVAASPAQKSPKSHKRFSIVFSRRGESPTLSPRSSQVDPGVPATVSPSNGVSPRSAAKTVPKGKVPSPRKTDRMSTPVFGRRKTGSPRGAPPDEVAQAPVSPPLSARELVADASALEALDDMLGKNEDEEL